jgi:DnaJ-class molecular chaperone
MSGKHRKRPGQPEKHKRLCSYCSGTGYQTVVIQEGKNKGRTEQVPCTVCKGTGYA